MAKNKRNRNYRFTPRRQAALRRAQARSAATRRRRVGRAAALVGGTLAVGAVAYGARRNLSRGSKGPGKALVHVPGLGRSHVEYRKTVIPPGWGKSDLPKMRAIRRTSKHVFKVDSGGTATSTTKRRMAYDTNRRREYWQAKPVGGAPRKTYTSKKRGRS